jgi:hypothetical protein
MSPFKSQGANRAIIDAIVLSRNLCELSIEEAIKKYENHVSEKSQEKVLISRNKVTALHTGKDIFDIYEDENATILGKEGIGAWTKDLNETIKKMDFKGIGNWRLRESIVYKMG